MTKSMLIENINTNACNEFQKKCKEKKITMAAAVRLFINSIASGELYFHTQENKLTTIKESQLKIKIEQ